MNYRTFLNKSNKFKNQNCYRRKNKNHKSKFFLLSSALALTFVLILVFISTDSHNFVQASQPQADTNISKTTHSPIKLPELITPTEQISVQTSYAEQIIATDNKMQTTKVKQSTIGNSAQSDNILVEDTVSTSIDTEKTIAPPGETVAGNNSSDITSEPVATIKNSSSILKSTGIIESIKKTIVVKKGDSLSTIFKRLSLSASTLYKIMHSSHQAKLLTHIKPGQELVISYDKDNQFKSLFYALDLVDTLIVERLENAQKYSVRVTSKDVDIQQQFVSATINNSLFSAANSAGLSSAMTMKLAQLFGWDIDFALDIRKGDSFAILFEEKYIAGNKIGTGNILSAEFINKGKLFTAVRYTDANNHTDYYSTDGLSMRKAFLRTPVDFSRISSRFSTGRKHPVLNRIRAHKGVDYAAARGTPIKAVGDGKVIFKGRKGGYGRVIILQHGTKYSTLYAHMNSYNRKIRRNTHVKQGQIIGYVGSSGLATGPHLHYEFRINGVHRNPLTVPLPSASPIAKKYRSDFQTIAETMVSQLKLRKQQTLALREQ